MGDTLGDRWRPRVSRRRSFRFLALSMRARWPQAPRWQARWRTRWSH